MLIPWGFIFLGMLTGVPAAALTGDARPPLAPCLDEAIPLMDAAGTLQDSLALATRFEQTPPGGNQACGQLLAGLLIGMTSTAAEDEWQRRLHGMELLDAAFREYNDEPRLYLARAVLLYHRQARTDALRMLDRAFERRDHGTPLRPREVMLIHYVRGLIHQDSWRDWRSFGQLKTTAEGQWGCGQAEHPEGDNFASSSSDHTWLLRLNQICPDRFAENMATYYDRRDQMRRDEFDALEGAFEAALAADPSAILPGEALLGEYVYLGMWERAETLVERLRARLPEDHRPRLYQGLVLHETGRDSLAVVAFASAFQRMPGSLADRYQDIAILLTPDQQAWFAAADSTTRRAAVTAYWNSLDPLYLTPVNERKTEHFARVVAADLMFTSPALRERGGDSYAGQLWIRYGRPVQVWELTIPAGRVVFWDYGPGPDASFTRGTAYRSYRPTDEVRQIADALQLTTPQTYAGKAVLDSVWGLGYQIVRMMDSEGRAEFLVYVEWPEWFSPEAMSGFVLFDARFQPAAQWRGGPPDEAGLHANLRGVPAGSYSITVEAFDPPQRALGRVRDSLTTLDVQNASFVVSDLLLASNVRPRQGDDATSRREMLIEPLYRPVLTPGQSLGLFWEIYHLGEDRDGRIEYDVSVEVQDATRQPILARALSGVGLGGEREPATRITYRSQRPLVDGRAVEWLELSSQLEPGVYRVVLTARDPSSGTEVRRERSVEVRRPD